MDARLDMKVLLAARVRSLATGLQGRLTRGAFMSSPYGAAASCVKGPRAKRVRRLKAVAEIVESAPFGSDRFVEAAGAGGYDVLCHHAARVGNYRSPDFDTLAENTANLRAVLKIMERNGLRGVVLTGSMFEQNEGAGEAPLTAFSPNGLSKSFTAAVVSHRCRELGLPYRKFFIPPPFGPLEEPGFCAHLTRSWKKGEIARVNTLNYVRDNIHVLLLADAYAKFVGEMAAGEGCDKLNPSGYVETQGAFAHRFAAAMRPRLAWSAGLSSESKPTSLNCKRCFDITFSGAGVAAMVGGDRGLRHMSISERKHVSEGEAPARRVEIFTGAGRRRSWSAREKSAIVAESFEEGIRACHVARRRGLTPLTAWPVMAAISISVAPALANRETAVPRRSWNVKPPRGVATMGNAPEERSARTRRARRGKAITVADLASETREITNLLSIFQVLMSLLIV
jgi:UDP-glucose 4-epimerase